MIKNESVYPQLVAKTTSLWWLPTEQETNLLSQRLWHGFKYLVLIFKILRFFHFSLSNKHMMPFLWNLLIFCLAKKLTQTNQKPWKQPFPQFLDFYLSVSFRPNATTTLYKTDTFSNMRVFRSFLLSIFCCWVLVVGWKPFNLPEVRSITNGHFPICDWGWQLLWFRAADPGGGPWP